MRRPSHAAEDPEDALLTDVVPYIIAVNNVLNHDSIDDS